MHDDLLDHRAGHVLRHGFGDAVGIFPRGERLRQAVGWVSHAKPIAVTTQARSRNSHWLRRQLVAAVPVRSGGFRRRTHHFWFPTILAIGLDCIRILIVVTPPSRQSAG